MVANRRLSQCSIPRTTPRSCPMAQWDSAGTEPSHTLDLDPTNCVPFCHCIRVCPSRKSRIVKYAGGTAGVRLTTPPHLPMGRRSTTDGLVPKCCGQRLVSESRYRMYRYRDAAWSAAARKHAWSTWRGRRRSPARLRLRLGSPDRGRRSPSPTMPGHVIPSCTSTGVLRAPGVSRPPALTARRTAPARRRKWAPPRLRPGMTVSVAAARFRTETLPEDPPFPDNEKHDWGSVLTELTWLVSVSDGRRTFSARCSDST